MNLKFMRKNQSATASPAASSSSPAVSASPVAPAEAGAQWSTAAQPLGVLLEEDAAAQPDGAQSLLAFRAGRRSFGGFNPRLEKRLGAISSNKRQVEADMKAAEAQEVARRRQATERTELRREVEADAAFEKKEGVSEAELAAAFGKYVLKGKASAGPPVVSNPVRVGNAPRKGGVGGAPSARPVGGHVPKYCGLATQPHEGRPAERRKELSRRPQTDSPQRVFKRPKHSNGR